MKEACGNCMWFKSEPNTSINPNSPVAQVHEAAKTVETKIALNGGSVPPTFGKCKAVFPDENNEIAVHNFGTFSDSLCVVKDDTGYKLFKIG